MLLAVKSYRLGVGNYFCINRNVNNTVIVNFIELYDNILESIYNLRIKKKQVR